MPRKVRRDGPGRRRTQHPDLGNEQRHRGNRSGLEQSDAQPGQACTPGKGGKSIGHPHPEGVWLEQGFDAVFEVFGGDAQIGVGRPDRRKTPGAAGS
ncbi:MAG: hypothetical protein ACC661_12000 [Verrucomicrobiales bacterium]